MCRGIVAILSQHVHSKHPHDKENCDNSPGDVNYPVASGFRSSKIEHAVMLAGVSSYSGVLDFPSHPAPDRRLGYEFANGLARNRNTELARVSNASGEIIRLQSLRKDASFRYLRVRGCGSAIHSVR
jgi:hypothetical protein